MTHDHAASQGRPEPQPTTSSISLADLAPVSEHALTPEHREAVQALPADSALLVSHDGPEGGARFLLDQDVVTVGRHPEADVFLDDVTVSRRHAQFRRRPEGYELVDSNSLNGTFVNRDRIEAVLLRTGMQVQIGKFRMTYHAAGQA
ncbi:FHA domain-containing protein [Micrococcus cohnii]|uniref:FHA domain-containing protein n=1 Tax=Micrococcus cohnii TaxID=993416 RepID=A0A7W7GNN9_9MICC|nr:FHA domain-containing protein [Micrococcus cohnii]MBB4735457.1 hypothetical protein [Micrococcus cohnii]